MKHQTPTSCRLTRRKALKWLGIGAASAFFAGCAPAAAPTPTTAPKVAATTAPGAAATAPPAATKAPEAPKVTPAAKVVTVSFSTDGNPEEFAAWEDCVKAFEAKNPTIKVERRFDLSYAHEKAHIMLGAGTAASIQRANDNDNFLVRAQGLIRGLDDWIARDLKRDDYLPATWTYFLGAGDEVCGVPLGFMPSVVFYNVKHFDEAKLEGPGEWAKAWDHRTMDEAVEKLTKKDASGKVTRYGYDAEGGMILALIHSFGASVYNDCETKCILMDSDAALRAITWWQDVYFKRKNGKPTGENTVQLFNSGMLATYNGNVAWANNVKTDVEYDVMPPWFGDAAPDKRKNSSNGASKNYVMPVSEKEPEAAWELMKWLWGEPGQKVISKIDKGVPTLKKVAESPTEYLDPKRRPKHRKLFMDSMSYTAPCPDNNPAGDDLAKWFNRTLNELIDGQKDPKTFLTERVERINAKLKDTEWDKCKNWTKGWKLGDKVAPLIPKGMEATVTARVGMTATATAAAKK